MYLTVNSSGIRKPKIAILGSRGIPATYGGYETIAQELGAGLAQKGFEVYVSCESHGFRIKPYGTYQGVRLVYFPVINTFRSISEAFLYDLLSVLWAMQRADIVYMLGYSSAPTLIFPKLLGKTVLVNSDGLEAARRKFNPLVRFFYRSFEKLSVKISDYIVVDSETIGLYYRSNYSIIPIYIPNGGGAVKEVAPLDSKELKLFGIEKGDYYLVIARLIPDNNIDLIIEGFKKANSQKKLVIVGPLNRTSYVSKLLLEKNDNILFIGGIYDLKLQRTLRCNCFAYIHGHEMGGTNPSLVEALSCRNTILALDVPFTREVAEDSATFFKKDANDLKSKIETLETETERGLNEEAYKIYKKKYSAEKTISAFIEFINSIANVKKKSPDELSKA
jgi:glycosyltransferase involved in cell wall biosynthesis